MTGDEEGDDSTYDQPRVPAALRDQIDDLFLEYRGYEPATFQESLSLVTDLAAARVEAELDGPGDAVPADGDAAAVDGEAAVSDDGHGRAATGGDGAAATASGDSVTEITADAVDEASVEEFPELDQRADGDATDAPASDAAESPPEDVTGGQSREPAAGSATDADVGGDADTAGDTGAAASVATDADDPVSGAIPDSLRADPESNCALCGDLHPVSVLETTILDGAGSVALVCPSCAE